MGRLVSSSNDSHPRMVQLAIVQGMIFEIFNWKNGQAVAHVVGVVACWSKDFMEITDVKTHIPGN